MPCIPRSVLTLRFCTNYQGENYMDNFSPWRCVLPTKASAHLKVVCHLPREASLKLKPTLRLYTTCLNTFFRCCTYNALTPWRVFSLLLVVTLSYRELLSLLLVVTLSYRELLSLLLVVTLSYRELLSLLAVISLSLQNIVITSLVIALLLFSVIAFQPIKFLCVQN